MKLPLLILGAGGHCKVLIDTLTLDPSNKILGLIDQAPQKHGTRVLGIEVLGGGDILARHSPESVLLVNAIGSVGVPTVRQRIFDEWKSKGYRFAQVIHPQAIVSRHAKIGEGAQILAGAVVQAETSIGNNVILNTRSSVDHDCTIGDHCHIAPGVTLSGGVIIESTCHVGTGANVIQGIRIGTQTVIAAGARVLKNVPAHEKYLGLS